MRRTVWYLAPMIGSQLPGTASWMFVAQTAVKVKSAMCV